MSIENQELEKLIHRLRGLNASQLKNVEQYLTNLTRPNPNNFDAPKPSASTWPHAPTHCLSSHGAYIITSGTLHKEHYFRTTKLLDYLQSELLGKAIDYRWSIEAWACFPNHYHFVAQPLGSPESLKDFVTHLHADTARHINLLNNTEGRQVWHNYYDTQITYEKSYLARLNYVHQNAVHHRIVALANQYPWCSAAWFESTTPTSRIKTIYSFKTDKVRVIDHYEVIPPLDCRN